MQPEMAADAERAAKLRRTVAAFPGPGFAVLDGARFEDLPKLCRRERLFARSLFLDRADVEVEKAGPWLIGLGQAPDALDKVLALVGEEPAAVFWCCDGGEAVLHRHLRTLNMARIPAWAADGGAAPPPGGSGQEPRPVMFRHWDPRVLGALMPALDGAQFARVLGPAAEIAFLTVDHGGVRRVLADPALPAAPGGLLAIRSDQMQALSRRRLDASDRRIAAYLRRHAPDQTEEFGDAELLDFVRERRREAAAHGLRAEDAVGMWCYMRATNTVDFSRDPQVMRFMADPSNGATPEGRLWRLAELRRRLLEARYG